MPPSLIRQPVRGPGGELLGLTHDQWRAGLTAPQAQYYEEYCDGSEETGYTQLCGATPLVLAFEDQRVAYAQGGRFALAPGDPVATDWPTAATPWLALDVDRDGAITSGAELFGSATLLPSGLRAHDGFEALAALDASGDGVIDAADPAFERLLVWADRDGDRRSTPAELTPASALVTSLSLAAQRVPHCDARGNCEGELAPLVWRDAAGAARTGSVVDVYLRFR